MLIICAGNLGGIVKQTRRGYSNKCNNIVCWVLMPCSRSSAITLTELMLFVRETVLLVKNLL